MSQPFRKTRAFVRVGLGCALVFAGVGHLSFARREFQNQVPEWVPADPDTTVVASGVAEVALGAWLLSGWRRRTIGRICAAFFVAVFPGNLSQWWHRRDGFGLDTDRKRLARLPMQPALIGAALWSTASAAHPASGASCASDNRH